MNADIQSMDDGDAKTKATKEMQMAEDMMASTDMKGCEAHMQRPGGHGKIMLRQSGQETSHLAALVARSAIVVAGAIAIYAGVYNVAADIPHTGLLADGNGSRAVDRCSRGRHSRAAIWAIPSASFQVLVNTRRCAPAVTSLRA